MRGRPCLRQPGRVTERCTKATLGARLPSAEACLFAGAARRQACPPRPYRRYGSLPAGPAGVWTAAAEPAFGGRRRRFALRRLGAGYDIPPPMSPPAPGKRTRAGRIVLEDYEQPDVPLDTWALPAGTYAALGLLARQTGRFSRAAGPRRREPDRRPRGPGILPPPPRKANKGVRKVAYPQVCSIPRYVLAGLALLRRRIMRLALSWLPAGRAGASSGRIPSRW